jgi:hypothetical protein
MQHSSVRDVEANDNTPGGKGTALMERVLAVECDVSETWLQRFEEHGVQFVVLDQGQDKDLAAALRCQPGWLVNLEGDGVVIFARRAHKGERQWTTGGTKSRL